MKRTGRARCELCRQPSPGRRLCPPCREMIARLGRIWPQLNVATRGVLHYFTMERQALERAGQQARGAACSSQAASDSASPVAGSTRSAIVS